MFEKIVPWRLEFLEAEVMGREVEGEDRSKCLSRTSLIRFRSSDLEAETETPPRSRSLYIPALLSLKHSSRIEKMVVRVRARVLDSPTDSYNNNNTPQS